MPEKLPAPESRPKAVCLAAAPEPEVSSARMNEQRIALVTGANKGIGLETSRQLARDHGAHVLMASRD